MTEAEARELLPWYAVGALDPGETAGVAAWLARSPALRLELAELRALETDLAEVEAEPAPPTLRPELLREALARIDAFERERRRPRARLSAWLGSLRDRIRSRLRRS